MGKKGWPTVFREEMLEKATAYIDGGYKELEQVIPSIAGLSLLIGVSRETLHQWKSDKSHPMSDTLSTLLAAQEIVTVNKGLSGEFNSAISKLVLHNHGYSDKQEIESEVKVTERKSISDFYADDEKE